jgi:nucleoredoxin
MSLAVLIPEAICAERRQNVVMTPHAGDLVVFSGDHLVPFDATQFLQARYTVLYFGAGWCPDCRRFSPSLVEAYNRQVPGVRQFEVLLLSQDKNPEGMLKFMKSEKMRWPALAFDKIAGAKDLNRFYSGYGIPCLTAIDSRGAIVLQSKSDQDAAEILKQLEALLGASGQK